MKESGAKIYDIRILSSELKVFICQLYPLQCYVRRLDNRAEVLFLLFDCALGFFASNQQRVHVLSDKTNTRRRRLSLLFSFSVVQIMLCRSCPLLAKVQNNDSSIGAGLKLKAPCCEPGSDSA